MPKSIPLSEKLKREQWILDGEEDCQRCPLAPNRNSVVFAEGSPDADIMFIAEAPGCFPAGTSILTPNGPIEIERLSIGDKVLGAKGQVQSILTTFSRKTDTLATIKLRGGHEIICTPEHPILTLSIQDCIYGGFNKIRIGCLPCYKTRCPHKLYEGYHPTWKQAKDLSPHDYVLIPRDLSITQTISSIDLSPYLYSRQGDKKPYGASRYDDSIVIDEDIAFLFGAFMADGCANSTSSSISITIGDSRPDEYADRIKTGLSKLTGRSISQRRGNNCTTLSVYDRVYARMFIDLFNHGARNKKVPSALFQSSTSVIETFLYSWYLGDGLHNKTKVDGICTASVQAKNGLVQLLLQLGVYPTVSEELPSTTSKGGGAHWKVLFIPTNYEEFKIGFNRTRNSVNWHNYICVRVNDISINSQETQVYNIETEDNSYCIPFIVHNSQEDKHGHPMLGPAGNNLDLLLAYAGIDRSRVIITNMIQCAPWKYVSRKGKWEIGKPKKAWINECNYWLDQKILNSNVKIIIPVGDFALKKFLPDTSISKVHGIATKILFESTRDDLPEGTPTSKELLIVPQYHPAYPLHDPSKKSILAADYAKLRDVLSTLPEEPPVENYKIATTLQDLKEIFDDIREKKVICFDYETTGLDHYIDDIVGIAITTEAGKAWYIPTFDRYWHPRSILKVLQKFFEDPSIRVIAKNLKFEIKFTEKYLGEVKWINYFDAEVEWYLLEAESIRLKDLALHQLNFRMTQITKFLGTKKKTTVTMLDASREDLIGVAQYASADADFTIRLHEKAIPMLMERGLWSAYRDIEAPLIPILADIDSYGAWIDREYVQELRNLYIQRMAEAEAIIVDFDTLYSVQETLPDPNDVYQFEGTLDYNPSTINVGSSEQVSVLLFDKIKLEPPAGAPVSEKGFYSTDAKKVLDEMEYHPCIEAIKDFRTFKKLDGTYCERLLQPHPITHKVHTHFNQTRTRSYRLSCLAPDTFLNSKNGLVDIEHINIDDEVWNGEAWVKILDKEKVIKNKVKHITLQSGRTITCSNEHKFATPSGFVAARDLAINDTLLSCASTPNLELKDNNDTNLWELIGIITADGHIEQHKNGSYYSLTIAFSNCDPDLRQTIDTIIKNRWNCDPYRTTHAHKYTSKKMCDTLIDYGLNTLHYSIDTPKQLYTEPPSNIAAFIRGYFEGDGSVSKSHGISCVSTSKKLLINIQRLLTQLGIQSIVSLGRKPSKDTHNQTYLLTIIDKKKFCTVIGFLSNRKISISKDVFNQYHLGHRSTFITFDKWLDLHDVRAILPTTQSNDNNWVSNFQSPSKRISRGIFNKFVSWAEDNRYVYLPENFTKAINYPLYEDEIVDIQEEIGEFSLYEIATESETYLAEGVLTHNSSDPINFQNIPARLDEGKIIRRAFIPSPGNVIMRDDFDQMELRVEAAFSKDPVKLEIYSRNGDIHGEVAVRMYGNKPDYEEHKELYRKKTKNVNFGKLYRGGAKKISSMAGLPLEEVKEIIKVQENLYAGSEKWFHLTVREMERLGYSASIFGHRRTLPSIRSPRQRFKAEDERNGYNHKIQSACASIMKRAMISLYHAMKDEGLKSRIFLQVHDELVIDLVPSEAITVYRLVKEIFEDCPEISVPMRGSVEIGPNWLDGTEVDNEEDLMIEVEKCIREV